MLTFALTMVSAFSIAQKTDTFHTDSIGHLFVNPKMPIHIYLSTSPDGKDAVRLKSQQPEGEPLYWNGHGPQYLTHLNLYLGRKIRFDLFADGLPPKTSPNFDVKQGYQKGNTIYVSGTATIELTSTDTHSGVDKLMYSVNGKEFAQYVQPIVFDSEGQYILKFYAIDNVGNKEDEGQRTILVDTTPPVTDLNYIGPEHNNVVASATKFELTAADLNGVKGTYYSIDDGMQKQYKAPIALSNLSEGDHSIIWYSVDMVGNTEENEQLNFFMDKTPPMVFEELVGNTYMVAGKEYSSGRTQLRIVAVDNKAGVKEIHYSINDQPFKLYEKPVYLSEISGAATVKSFAIDNVGNKGVSDTEGQQFSMPKVDITGPNIKYTLKGPRLTLRDSLWLSPKTKIGITATDDGSGLNRIEYKINENAPGEYTDEFCIDQSGAYTIVSTAWDNVENLNISNLELHIDADAPELLYNFSVKPHRYINEGEERVAVYSNGVLVYLAATDDIVGIDRIMVSVNDSREKAYTQPLSGFKANQTHTLKLRAIDRLGNEKEITIKFRVE